MSRPETKERHRAALIAYAATDDAVEFRRAVMTANWQRPEFVALMPIVNRTASPPLGPGGRTRRFVIA